jgi:hypothetical protein
MWDEPYLETCCRSALHRLSLSGATGRRADNMDGACLARLETMGLAERRGHGSYVLTVAGTVRHDRDVRRRSSRR